MAVSWTSSAPPHSVGERRSFGCGLKRHAALWILCAFAGLPTSTFAQDIGLRRGEASLNSGQFNDAARQLSATVNDKDSTINQVARALYLRGIAYRRAGYPGQAVSDLGAAIWLGLPSSDKARAYVNKGLAFQAAGMASQSSSAMAQARRYSNASTVERLKAQDGGVAPVASSSIADYVPGASLWNKVVPSFGSSNKTGEPVSAQASEASAQSTAAAEPQAAPTSGWEASVDDGSGGNAVSRWWGSVAGGGASRSQPAPSPTNPIATPSAQSAAAARTTTATRTAAAPPSAESWAANTEVSNGSGGSGIGGWFSRQTAAATAVVTGGGRAATGSARQPITGAGYTVQLANSRSKSEAEALWNKAKRSNSSLASASPRIETVNLGNLGTFYTVKIGPFASQSQGTKICNSLKRGGTDCSVISPGGP